MDRKITLSVHQLVDFLLRTGDIDTRVFNKATMMEGSKIHAFYQSRQGPEYLSEYLLFEKINICGYEVSFQGRADGIIYNGVSATVDEIKSTIIDLKDFHEQNEAWHLGQAKCYALMFAHEKKLNTINVRLTYLHQTKKDKLIKDYAFEIDELENDIYDLFKRYFAFFDNVQNHIDLRNTSSEKLSFPFKTFREGQRKLAKYAYSIAKNGGTLFCEAPTGIGKTMSTLFPYVKSFADKENEKIFYFTAKSSGKDAANNACKILRNNGAILSSILLTAKEKICFKNGANCNPDECPFAKGYYNKIQGIIASSLKENDYFDFDIIYKIAEDNEICPMEFQLDLSLFVDVIICDYNYLFDPLVYLRRYFDNDASKTLVLIDEAHNLVERGRDMYSASIDTYAFDAMKKSLKHIEHKKIQSSIKKISSLLNATKKDFEPGNYIIDSVDEKLLKALDNFLLASKDVSKNASNFVTKEMVDFSRETNRFIKLLELYDDSFKLYITKIGKRNLKINLFCLDPSKQLHRCMSKVKGRILFSATLTPSEYYIKMLGGKKEDPVLLLPSPFDKDKLCLMIAPTISVAYKKRETTYQSVVDYINTAIKGKIGNYLIFFPSYEYLNKIMPLFIFDKDVDYYIQNKDMSEIEKEGFLSYFTESPIKTTLGFAVLGGAFSEGIDLVADRLIGVVIVGVGLPQISFERDLIKDYFDKKDEKSGFEYAYVNPGMNHVMQATGRVIRSEDDKGIALLIDDRFLNKRYRDLFKHEWSNYDVVTSNEDIKELLSSFWGENK